MTAPSIGWVPGIPPADKIPYVEAERFLGTGKEWRVWLLADVRCVTMHYMVGQRSQPCIAHMGECPWCKIATWWKRFDGYVPAMLEARKGPRPEWKPILAVLTEGGARQVGKPPHRGLMFKIFRQSRGSRCTPLKLEYLQTSDPLRPSFDIEPLMKRMWWPEVVEAEPARVELPDPIPIPPSELHRPTYLGEAEPVVTSPVELRRLHAAAVANKLPNLAANFAAQLDAMGEPLIVVTTPSAAGGPAPVTPAQPPTVSPSPKVQPEPFSEPPTTSRPRFGQSGHSPMVPSADAVDAALRRRGIQIKPAEELTPEEAIDGDRILDFVTAKPSKNGHAPKGGAQ